MLLQRKLGKESRHKEPALRSRFLMYPPEGGGILAFEAKMLHTHKNLLNDPPIKRKAFLGAGLLFL